MATRETARRNLLPRVAWDLSDEEKNRWYIDHPLLSLRAMILEVILVPRGDGHECRCRYPAYLHWFQRLPREFPGRLPESNRQSWQKGRLDGSALVRNPALAAPAAFASEAEHVRPTTPVDIQTSLRPRIPPRRNIPRLRRNTLLRPRPEGIHSLSR